VDKKNEVITMSTRLGSDYKPEQSLVKAREVKKARMEAEKAEAAKELKANPKWPPFEGKEKLPNDVEKNKKGRVTSRGSYRYALMLHNSGVYKLLAYFRNGKGIGSALVKVLKPNKTTKNGVRDRALLEELKAAGVPILSN
jgi:hypothetical protein